MTELSDRADALLAERQRPEVKPDGPTIDDLFHDLISALHALYRTPPDRRSMGRRTSTYTPSEASRARIASADRNPTGSLRAQLAEEIHLPPDDPAEQAAARRLVLRMAPDHAGELLDVLGLADA